ncbi:MAG: metallophosphoesterase, partial [Methanobacterium sp.]|nr:metallophosphoesterase [Methanobacterium sp.]
LRKIIEEFQPSINLCGHIHESRAIDKIGKTNIINPGMLKERYACIININGSDDNIKINSELITL